MDRRSVLVLAFLGLQLGLPLSYYLGHDRYDERFAWRMFSPQRMVRCQVSVRDSGTVSVSSEVAAPWVSWMRRGHLRVVYAYAERRCAEQGGPLFIDLRCRLPDGTIDQLLDPDEDLCP